MPSIVAAFLSAVFVLWTFRVDNRNGFKMAVPFIIPLIWMMLLGSRPLSVWLGTATLGDNSAALEGNPFDRNVYLILATVAFFIVQRRGVNWGALINNNTALFLFYGFLLASCLWSNHPFVTFKRWFKELLTFPILLLILSVPDPKNAIQTVFARCATVLFVLSLLFIKYYPALGRVYFVTGSLQVVGVAEQKNLLGEDVLVFGLVLMWRMFSPSPPVVGGLRWRGAILPVILFTLGAWLLLLSDSKTSLICLMGGLAILVSDKLPIIRGRPGLLLGAILIGGPLFYVAEQVFDVSAMLLQLAGRDPTFTGRRGIWDAVSQHPVDPLFGCGYQMYWDELGWVMINGFPTQLKTAHNGYIDLYLDGGWIGLGFFAAMMIATGRKVVKDFLSGSAEGRLRFALLVVIMLANLSESSFARRGPLWLAFLLFCVDYSRVFPGNRRPMGI